MVFIPLAFLAVRRKSSLSWMPSHLHTSSGLGFDLWCCYGSNMEFTNERYKEMRKSKKFLSCSTFHYVVMWSIMSISIKYTCYQYFPYSCVKEPWHAENQPQIMSSLSWKKLVQAAATLSQIIYLPKQSLTQEQGQTYVCGNQQSKSSHLTKLNTWLADLRCT